MRVTRSMPAPPAGPVPARISLRTSCGSCRAITCAIIAAQREPEQVDLLQTEGAHEHDGVSAIASIVAGVDPLEAPTPAVVEGDDRARGGDAVDDPRVPVVQDRGQVGEEHHRRARARAESPVGEADAAGLQVCVGASFQLVALIGPAPRWQWRLREVLLELGVDQPVLVGEAGLDPAADVVDDRLRLPGLDGVQRRGGHDARRHLSTSFPACRSVSTGPTCTPTTWVPCVLSSMRAALA